MFLNDTFALRPPSQVALDFNRPALKRQGPKRSKLPCRQTLVQRQDLIIDSSLTTRDVLLDHLRERGGRWRIRGLRAWTKRTSFFFVRFRFQGRAHDFRGRSTRLLRSFRITQIFATSDRGSSINCYDSF